MIDIMRLAPDQVERLIHMQAIVDRQQEVASKVKALRDYYDGNHPVLLTQRQEEFIGKGLTSGDFAFAHNLLRTIVDTLRERLEVTGFALTGEDASEEEQAAVAAQLWAWWKAARMDAQQIDAYRNALRDGWSYVMVDYDNEAQRPRFTVHQRDDGTSGVLLHRDPEDTQRVLFATRYFWTFDPLNPGVTGIERKTVYLPGEIRKYKRVTSLSGWTQMQDDGDVSWPLPWVDWQGRPLGVPVFEFANPGGSEMEQVAGLQNALNKAWLDLIAAADASGFPVMALEYPDTMPIGTSQDDDDIEGDDELRIAPGRAVTVEGGTIKRLDAANLAPMMDVIWAITAAISGVSRTPQYYLRPFGGADVPSGEALKTLESGLVKRAQQRQLSFGQTWEDVMSLAWRVAQTFGAPLPGPERVALDVQWRDAETRNEIAEAQTAQTHKALGVPDEQVWMLLGYTPEQIAEFSSRARANRAADVASIAAAMRTQTVPSAVGGNNVGTGNPVQS